MVVDALLLLPHSSQHKFPFAVARPQSRSSAALWPQSLARLHSRIFAGLWPEALTQPQSLSFEARRSRAGGRIPGSDSRMPATHSKVANATPANGRKLPSTADAEDCLQGIITAGMAWRVKYRVLDGSGEVVKRHCPILYLGVHLRNRGGIYPSGVRCKGLGVDVVAEGFAKEECNHAGVAVEEIPSGQRQLLVDGCEDMRSFNITRSEADELLKTCFSEPWADVRQGTLSHTHLMLVLRALTTKAEWDVPDITKDGIIYCDAGGRLSLTAVAEHPNAQPMLEVVQEGLLMEILSWKMDVEEPNVASTISQALNKGRPRSPYD